MLVVRAYMAGSGIDARSVDHTHDTHMTHDTRHTRARGREQVHVLNNEKRELETLLEELSESLVVG
jgi:hypothetical protein